MSTKKVQILKSELELVTKTWCFTVKTSKIVTSKVTLKPRKEVLTKFSKFFLFFNNLKKKLFLRKNFNGEYLNVLSQSYWGL